MVSEAQNFLAAFGGQENFAILDIQNRDFTRKNAQIWGPKTKKILATSGGQEKIAMLDLQNRDFYAGNAQISSNLVPDGDPRNPPWLWPISSLRGFRDYSWRDCWLLGSVSLKIFTLKCILHIFETRCMEGTR